MKIISAIITPTRDLVATFEDGSKKTLFSVHPDWKLKATSLVGLTEEEAITMKETDPKSPSNLLNEMRNFATALLSGKHSIKSIIAEFNPLDSELSPPFDPTGLDTNALNERIAGRIIPTPGVAKYLASGDVLTNEHINNMEIALQNDYGIKKPFFISSIRTGDEKSGTLAVDSFILESTDDPWTKPEPNKAKSK